MVKGLYLYFTMEELRDLSVVLAMCDNDARVYYKHIARNGFPDKVLALASEHYDFVHSVFNSFEDSCDAAVKMEVEKD